MGGYKNLLATKEKLAIACGRLDELTLQHRQESFTRKSKRALIKVTLRTW